MSRTYKHNSKYQPRDDRRTQRQTAARAPRRGELRLRDLGHTAVDLAAHDTPPHTPHPVHRMPRRGRPTPSERSSV